MREGSWCRPHQNEYPFLRSRQDRVRGFNPKQVHCVPLGREAPLNKRTVCPFWAGSRFPVCRSLSQPVRQTTSQASGTHLCGERHTLVWCVAYTCEVKGTLLRGERLPSVQHKKAFHTLVRQQPGKQLDPSGFMQCSLPQ